MQISVKGQMREVPSIRVDCRDVVVGGRFIKVASVHDEPFLEGEIGPC